MHTITGERHVGHEIASRATLCRERALRKNNTAVGKGRDDLMGGALMVSGQEGDM